VPRENVRDHLCCPIIAEGRSNTLFVFLARRSSAQRYQFESNAPPNLEDIYMRFWACTTSCDVFMSFISRGSLRFGQRHEAKRQPSSTSSDFKQNHDSDNSTTFASTPREFQGSWPPSHAQ
jgi:hypothetical protein